MRTQLLLISSIFLLAFTSLTRAQGAERDSVTPPYPVIGWEKLDSVLVYPEIAKRAGIEGFFIFSLVIDSTGNSILLDVAHSYPAVTTQVKAEKDGLIELFGDTFKNIKWVPAKKDGKNIYYKIDIPVVYFLTEEGKPPLIIKSHPRPIIIRDITW